MAAATIVITDSTGTTVAQTTTAADGTFSVLPSSSAVAPFVLVATAPSGTTLASAVSNSATAVVNVTPLSNLICALLSSNGMPSQLASDVVTTPARVSASAVASAKNQVAVLIKPLTDSVGVTGTDPINTAFSADGSGMDRVLDSLDIEIRSAGNYSDIQITMRELLADTESPAFVSFTSAAVPSTVSYSVDSSKLIPLGTSSAFNGLLAQLQTCYATGGRTSGSTVTSASCKAAFYNGDPTSYLNGGRIVSAYQAFSGLFSSNDTGETFTEGKYLYSKMVTVPGGGSALAHVFRYNAAVSGSGLWDSITVTMQNGSMVLLGDQHVYSGSTSPFEQIRNYVNQSSANLASTGPEILVSNLYGPGSAFTGFDHVVASSSIGTFTLSPTPGTHFLTVTGTSADVPRLAGAFTSPTTASQKGLPSSYVANVPWISPALSDAQIANLNELTPWTLQYFVRGNSGPTPDAIQYIRSESRPLTLAEITVLAPSFPVLVTPSSTGLIAATQANGSNGYINPPVSGPYSLTFSTPTGARPVTVAAVLGETSGGELFEDSASVYTTQYAIPCQAVTYPAGDSHCLGASYSSGDQLQEFQLEQTRPDGDNAALLTVIATLF